MMTVASLQSSIQLRSESQMPQRGKGITMNLLNNEPQHPTTNDQTPIIEDDNNLLGNESESQSEPVISNASDNTGDANGTVNASDDADASTDADTDAGDDASDDSEAITLDQKLVANFLTDENIYMLYKGVAQAGGMLMYGIKDADHLVEVVNAQSAHVRMVADFMSAKQSLNAIGMDKLVGDALDGVDDETLKGLSGEMRFGYHDGELKFEFALAHHDLPEESTHLKRGKNGNGNGNGNRRAGVQRTKGVFAPLTKSHRDSGKYAYFVLQSLGYDHPNKSKDLYSKDNIRLLVEKSAKLRNEMGFDKDAPPLTGEDTQDRQMWVASLNIALAKHHGNEIEMWS